MVFCISAVSVCDFSFFVSYFVYLGFFSPLLGESSQRFVNFVYLFKEPALGFINFLYGFVNLYFIDFFFDLYSFLPSADFGTFCSFSNSFKWRVNLSIWDLSSFLRKACIAINFPVSTAFASSHRF